MMITNPFAMLLIQASGDSSKKYFPLAKMVYSCSERQMSLFFIIKIVHSE